MATVTLTATLTNGVYLTGGNVDLAGNLPSQTTMNTDVAAIEASRVAFEAALATLVADGASPTQAHVTAVNSAYTTLKTAQLAATGLVGTDWTAYKAALAAQVTASSGNAVLSYSNSTFDTAPKIHAMWRAFARALGVPGIGA